MAPTHNEIGLRLLIGPRRIQGLALKTGADSAVPERDQVRVVGPALGVCRCHRRRPKKTGRLAAAAAVVVGQMELKRGGGCARL